ncbi:DJ-1/PfpI family protein [Paenibacillus agilis]|uniref:4-methyl-5(B-hydroxyethyl)-thiazole monophosphate biosynthesis protein n=1 Tax=Paenibacillus agilis TaxID=3020863 RepID=A0A559J2N8_9BACL|nr:DJ-1/PfpI family protein [Paenibacillus agilis]TVX94096.1 4-methyl-5(B-hydroxyethyl)-thiazole monophosphate biosynthesis protein [Paenibacillus agilis]
MKTTGVLLYPLFSEYEISVALSILKQGNHPITTIGIEEERGLVVGESDFTCVPDTTIHEVDMSTLDSLLLPGCMDISTLFEHEALMDFLRKCAEVNPNLIIASISSSPYLLARAGLIGDRTYTVGLTQEQRQLLQVFQEENYRNDLVVRDGNLITARGSGFIEFGEALGKELNLSFQMNWYQRNS